jgi:hypothetical protein
MCQEHEDENDGEYWGEIPKSDPCFLCGNENVHSSDRWNFQLENKYGTDVDNFWLCRECHGRFETVDEFDKFRRDFGRTRLYRACASLQRLLIMDAPEIALALDLKLIFLLGIRDKSKLGKVFLEELKRSSPDSVVEEGSNE